MLIAPMAKRRLDLLLVERNLVPTRQKAQAVIMAGEVRVNGQVVDKPGTLIGQEVTLDLAERPPYVSRGGEKLAYALDRFGIEVQDMAVADIGASTGPPPPRLLQHGARLVYAIDVGRGQLDYNLRRDPRVVVMEGTNARYLEGLPEQVDIATIDVSFISLQKVLPAAASILKPGSYIVALFKPQFQAHRNEVGKGGVIRDPQLHAKLLGRFAAWAADNKFRLRDLTLSPLRGPAGNREFLLLLQPERMPART
jgi:23S rRNA (cytidine1920-2'-O)/16S rRNA (cytidine1409-2'-O)-methyltransferase